jgi:peptidoglycan/LPS O-acetylase OafA/YrhL
VEAGRPAVDAAVAPASTALLEDAVPAESVAVNSRETAAETAPRRLGRQPSLDGLRGLAVLLVMAFHFGMPLPEGGVGVDIFFALSGFLITSLLLAERDETGTIRFGSFYARRARRLLPALFLVLAAFAVVHHFFHMLPLGIPLWSALLYPIFFASNFLALVHGTPPLNALNPTWSLAVEEQFYLLWPLALWLCVRRRVRPVVMIVGLAIVGLALVYCAHKIPWHYPHWSIYFNPLDRMAQLLLGCVAAFLFRYRLVPAVLRWRPLGWLALFVIIVMAFRDQTTLGDKLQLAPWTNIQLEYLSITALAFLIIISLVENPDSDLAQLFRFPALRYIGKVSYALYLMHLPVIAVIRQLEPRWTDYTRAPIALVVCLVLASASWYLVEAPIQRWGRERARRAGRSAAEPPPGGNARVETAAVNGEPVEKQPVEKRPAETASRSLAAPQPPA